MNASRRHFLQSVGATATIGGLAGCTFGYDATCPSAQDSLKTTIKTTNTNLGPLTDAWPMQHNDAAATGYTDGSGPQRGVVHRRLFTGAGSYFPSVIVGHDRVYVTSRQPELLALDPVDGRVDWRYEQIDSGGASTAVTDGLVLVAAWNGLHAVDPTTGDQRWRLDGSFNGEKLLLVDDGTAYACTNEEMIVAFDVETGEVDWRVNGWALGAVADGRVYIGVSTGLQALDADDGHTLWHSEDDAIVGETVAVWDGTVYVDGGAQWGHIQRDPGRVFALNATDGSQQWAFQKDTGGFESLAVAPDALAAGTGYGSSVHVLALQDGQQQWCAKFGSRQIQTLAIADDVVYIVAGDVIQARQVDNGDPLWTKQADADERLSEDDEEQDFYHDHALSGGVLVAAGYGRQGLVVDAFAEQEETTDPSDAVADGNDSTLTSAVSSLFSQ